MSYNKEELALLNYKELRKLCKQTSVKANRKHVELVNDLAEYFLKEENELKELEKEMEVYEKTDLNITYTHDEEADKNETYDKDKEKDVSDESEGKKGIELLKNEQTELKDPHKEEEQTELKDTLMKEVERRAEEKLSKIPRFVADKVFIPDVTPAQPTTPDISKMRNGHGIKMDSIDKYLAKKKKRASEHLKFNDNFKENTLPSKRMKMSNSSSALKKPRESKRKSIKMDTEVTLNFEPRVKSTPSISGIAARVSPRIAALNEQKRPKPTINTTLTDVNKTKSNVTFNSSGKRNKRVTIAGGSSRKSAIHKSATRKSEGRKSLSEKSPFLPKVQTPKAKTPIKFDLKASLKKALPYKPHTGRLKEAYFTQESTTGPRNPIIKKEERKKVSVKELTKNVSTREKRRNEAADKRQKSRLVVLDKRRGIVC